MIVDGNDRSGVEEDRWFEDFTRVHNAESECPDRHDIHADADILSIETTDEELLAIEPLSRVASRSHGANVHGHNVNTIAAGSLSRTPIPSSNPLLVPVDSSYAPVAQLDRAAVS